MGPGLIILFIASIREYNICFITSKSMVLFHFSLFAHKNILYASYIMSSTSTIVSGILKLSVFARECSTHLRLLAEVYI